MTNIFTGLGLSATIGVGVGLGLGIFPAFAQIMPDASLTTQVTSSPNFTITGGSRSGNNLFHSFSEFTIPTGSSALFDNALDIQNIFSRVTGPNISNLDGALNANGTANLFLLNPNGVIFGPNATLNIGGSFLSTTANTIKFADGAEFSASNPTSLLTISVPIGLQTGSNPGTITVQGLGHQLTTQNPILAPYVPIGFAPGLMVRPGKTIALVGGNVNLTSGILTAPSGHVGIASLGANATIALTPNFQLGDAGANRQTIQLTQKSLIDVNAIDAGSIQLQAQNIDLQTGSLLWVQNRSPNPSGDIIVNATNHLTLDGVAPDYTSVSSIINETVGGPGGNIDLNAPNISVTNGANIMTRAFGPGPGGNLTIAATDLEIIRADRLVPGIFSNIVTYTAGPSTGGNLRVNAQTINLQDGTTLGAITVGSGQGGDLNISADTVRLSGLTPNGLASTISAPTIGGSGNAGNLTLNTRQLALSAGGLIAGSSLGLGNAGRITVNATESITVAGFPQYSGIVYQTGIASAVSPAVEPYKTFFRLTNALPTGSSGDLTINTPNLQVYDGAYVTVENLGSGMAGNINVNADRITLKNGGYIAASSLSGKGGNLLIQSNLLLMNQNDRISTTANGNGNGGNIYISSPTIVGANNSDITANAVTGAGGKVKIDTQGLFGLKYRPHLTAENDITASSEFGLSGSVNIQNPIVNPNASLIELPTNPINPNQQVAQGCNNSNLNSSFIITGRGGIPLNPMQTVNADRPWQDPRNITPSQLIEATTWQLNPHGQTQLVAGRPIDKPKIITCTGSANVKNP
jgi:filamentous hemagglutinin family protein